VYVTAGNPYYMGTPLYERDMPTCVRYDVKATYDIGRFQGALFATPQRTSSPATSRTARRAGWW